MNRLIKWLIWNLSVYLILFISNLFSNKLEHLAATKFDNGYILLSLFIKTVLILMVAISYYFIVFQGGLENKKYVKYEFIIIGLNALFLTSIFILVCREIKLPRWLASNYLTANVLGSLILGIELARFMKQYSKTK